MSLKRCVAWVGVLNLLIFVAQPASGAALEDTAKQKALKWLKSYQSVNQIFHRSEIERVMDELEAGTEDQAEDWLKKTRKNRDVLDSSRWKQSQAWLRDFLPVQGMYTKEDLAKIRTEMGEAFKQSVADGNTDKFV